MNVLATCKAVTDVNLDEMVAESIKDTNSDDESEGNDDPALLVHMIFDYITS